MTAEPATYPAMLILEGGSPRRPDPVRARIAAGSQPMVHSQGVLMTSTEEAGHRGLHLTPGSRMGALRRFHPGDVLYWVACLGGAGLLLLCATT
ncbi:MAG TPA: hypothetical protein VGN01_07395 [Acidobacteriaceae bacterium]|jgi:hypothetical protein